MAQVQWKAEPEEHDYPAALSYLSLLAAADQVERILADLKSAEIVQIKAKDLIRASGLTLLPPKNFHVARDLRKIHKEKVLSPVLLVRGIGDRNLPLTIADGYHRICAVYWNSEDDFVHAKMVNWY